MSVQNEIERINNNVQAALSVVADAGVSVPDNANSNNLPAAVSALANEKQDKLTGTKGQIVGFDSDGKPVAQDKTSYGVATLGADGKLTGTQVPMQQIIAVTNAAEYSATATYAMGDYCTYDGKLYRCTTVITEAEAWTAAHWTETTMGAEMVSIYTTLQKKADTSSVYTKSESISAETRTALSLAETATPDAALAEIARQLSESGGLKLTKLWENASPTSLFPAQTITLDANTGDYLIILFHDLWDKAPYSYKLVKVGVSFEFTLVRYYIYYREFSWDGVNLVVSDNIYQTGYPDGTATNDVAGIPYMIYKITGISDSPA